MLFHLSVPMIILLDFTGWFFIQMGMAYFMTRMPAEIYNPDAWLFRPRDWEDGGALYQQLFRVRHWKQLLPDGAALFAGGFRKKHIADVDPEYYHRFIIETCRGEVTHWAVILCTPVFFMWNYWWADIIMIVYAISANMPCIITQRYNRLRLLRVYRKKKSL